MFRIITNIVNNCSTSAGERRRQNMQWSGSWVNEKETSALSLADLQRVSFYARQKKGISNEVMHLVNRKFEEEKI